MKKRFLLFAGNEYYPLGGGRDFKGSYSTLEDAIDAHDANEYEYDGGWANIFDLETEKVIKVFDDYKWVDPGHLQL